MTSFTVFSQGFVEKYSYISTKASDNSWKCLKETTIIMFDIGEDKHIEFYVRQDNKLFIFNRLSEAESVNHKGYEGYRFIIEDESGNQMTMTYFSTLTIVTFDNGISIGYYKNKPSNCE